MAIVWQPIHPEKTNMWQFMRFVEQLSRVPIGDYQDLYNWSIQKPEDFWKSLCEFFDIHFSSPPNNILKNEKDLLKAKWFEGALFNFAEQLLKRSDTETALICINELAEREELSFEELRAKVAFCAKALEDLGVSIGDRVAAILPNVSYTIIAMLATASLGAIWSSCSPDFGADAIIDRFSQIKPKVLFACDGHLYAGKKHDSLAKITTINQAIHSLEAIVICPILNTESSFANLTKVRFWGDFCKTKAPLKFRQLPFEHPLYIMFSSGTTGKPKCIVHSAGGTFLQHLKELGLHTDLDRNDNLCFYTTCGWMMWNWMVSALALGSSLTLYEGSPIYPDGYRMFKLIDEEDITVFGTSAKFLSSICKEELKPKTQAKLSTLRTILSTGSPLLPKIYDYVYGNIKADVQLSSISGGTDIISCFALGNPLLPVYRGELQCIGLGMAVQIFNEKGEKLSSGKGELVCTKPFPSMPIGFWQDESKTLYKRAYFERFNNIWAHGDFAELSQHHGLIIHGRSDTVLNPGGVRIGTAEIYRQVEKIPEVLESVAVAQDWQDDVRIILFVKLKKGLVLDKDLEDKIRLLIRTNTSPRHVPAKILEVKDIPHTINGKIVEIAIRDTVNGLDVKNLDSLLNPEALNYFKSRPELA